MAYGGWIGCCIRKISRERKASCPIRKGDQKGKIAFRSRTGISNFILFELYYTVRAVVIILRECVFEKCTSRSGSTWVILYEARPTTKICRFLHLRY